MQYSHNYSLILCTYAVDDLIYNKFIEILRHFDVSFQYNGMSSNHDLYIAMKVMIVNLLIRFYSNRISS